MKHDDLAIRMKGYEAVTKASLMRRGFTILRIDGKAFHSYTKGLKRPFDEGLTEDMNATAEYLCANIQNAKFAYIQSDEISVFLTDFDTLETQPWFGNEVQKMVSVSASLATAKFNQARFKRLHSNNGIFNSFLRDEHGVPVRDEYNNPIPAVKEVKLAHFDSRVFQVPTKTEAFNYLKWRVQDCRRNSVSSVAQANFSAKELHGQGRADQLEMLNAKGIDWESFAPELKYGRITKKETYQVPMCAVDTETVDSAIIISEEMVDRTRWVTVPAHMSGEGWLDLVDLLDKND